MNSKMKETLQKQLELLSKRSQECPCDSDLAALTSAMIETASLLCGYSD